jgi:hypothetical protein
VFTHEIVSALLGAADVNADMRIEYSEVQAFVASANRKVTDPRAVPEIIALPPAGNPHATLVDLGALKRTVLFTTGARDLGRFSINLPDGRRIVDANVLGLERLVLALPQQRGIYVQRGDVEAELPARRVVTLDELNFAPIRSTARGPIDRTLRDELFASAFTQDYYRGFVDSHGLPGVDLPGSPTPLPATGRVVDTSPHRPSRALSLTLVGVAAAATVTAGVMTILALDTLRQFNETSLQRRSYELRDRYETYVAAASVGFVIGAGAGVGAWLTWPTERNRASGLGVSWSGQF